eukprot:scaffold435706_cov18-Prasinocladus_malaysianus.AAC.1
MKRDTATGPDEAPCPYFANTLRVRLPSTRTRSRYSSLFVLKLLYYMTPDSFALDQQNQYDSKSLPYMVASR